MSKTTFIANENNVLYNCVLSKTFMSCVCVISVGLFASKVALLHLVISFG